MPHCGTHAHENHRGRRRNRDRYRNSGIGIGTDSGPDPELPWLSSYFRSSIACRVAAPTSVKTDAFSIRSTADTQHSRPNTRRAALARGIRHPQAPIFGTAPHAAFAAPARMKKGRVRSGIGGHSNSVSL